MPNMSYCRFQNTVSDLDDCLENLLEDVSPEEHDARVRLIETAREIVRQANEARWICEEQEDEDETEAEDETTDEDEG